MPVQISLGKMSEVQGIKVIVDITVAATASVLAQAIGMPIQRLQLLANILRDNNTTAKPISSEDVLNQAISKIRTEGLRYLWWGSNVSPFRNAPYQAVCFSTKNYLCNKLKKRDQPEDKAVMIARHMVSGGLAGIFSTFLTYPIDIPRVVLASNSFSYKKMYKGFGIAAVIAFIFRACYFGFYDGGKLIIWGQQRRITLLNRIGLAYLTTFLASFFALPIIMIRKKIHQDYHISVGGRSYTGAFDCAKKMLETDGISIFFRGILSNLPAKIGQALTLVFFDEIIKRIRIPQKGESVHKT